MQYFSLTPETTREELNDQYRTLAKQHHPDLGGDAEVMKEINAEYPLALLRVGEAIPPSEVPLPKPRKERKAKTTKPKKRTEKRVHVPEVGFGIPSPPPPKKAAKRKKSAKKQQTGSTFASFLADVVILGAQYLKNR